MKNEEKELGRAYARKVGILSGFITIMGIISFVFTVIGTYSSDWRREEISRLTVLCNDWKKEQPSFCEELSDMKLPMRVGIYILVGTVIVSLIFFLIYSKTVIVVTDKRVYGKIKIGKQIDIPLDSISSVSKGWLSSIRVASSSGVIAFSLLANRNDVYEIISNLLLERQDENNRSKKNTKQVIEDDVELLKKYKKLLDDGVITEEEFKEKKKQIMKI